jgi:hypothetical protein
MLFILVVLYIFSRLSTFLLPRRAMCCFARNKLLDYVVFVVDNNIPRAPTIYIDFIFVSK